MLKYLLANRIATLHSILEAQTSHGAFQPETATIWQRGDSPEWRSDLRVRFFPFRELTPVTSTRNGFRKVEMSREIFQ